LGYIHGQGVLTVAKIWQQLAGLGFIQFCVKLAIALTQPEQFLLDFCCKLSSVKEIAVLSCPVQCNGDGRTESFAQVLFLGHDS